MTQRHGKPWTINELLQLERECELLNLPIHEIAYRHKRTPKAIRHKIYHCYELDLLHWDQTLQLYIDCDGFVHNLHNYSFTS